MRPLFPTFARTDSEERLAVMGLNSVTIQNGCDVPQDAIGSLFMGELDVLVVRGFSPKELTERMLSAFARVPTAMKHRFEADAGHGCPMPFSLLSAAEPDRMRDYITQGDWFEAWLQGIGPSGPIERLQTFLSQHSGGKHTQRTPLRQGMAPFASFRSLRPGAGGMAIHRGAELMEIYGASFYGHLAEGVSISRGQLGYFITLQPAESGGNLRVFDPTDEKPDAHSITHHQDILAHAGDMVIIRESPLWHCVTPVMGSQDRITFGGFLFESADGSGLYSWS